MTEFIDQIDEYKKQGLGEDYIQRRIKQKQNYLLQQGYSVDQVQDELGVSLSRKEIDPEISKPIESFWQKNLPDLVSDLKGIKRSLVGEEAEWQEYWERGLGKSNINLAMQYHSEGKSGYDWKKAFAEESEDTGILERYFESLVSLGADTPTFFLGGAFGGLVSGGNPFATGFGAAFVNDSIKAMYLEALNKGKVNNFGEWFNIFMKHGVKEGVKGGLTVGSMAIAPAMAGRVGASLIKLKRKKPMSARVRQKIAGNISRKHLTKFLSMYTALTGVGAVMDGKMPDRNHLVNNALILGTFGIAGKGIEMVKNRAAKTAKNHIEVTQEVQKNPQMKEDAVSINKKTFRKDKELDKSKVKELQEEYKEVTKKLEEGVVRKNKEQLVEEKLQLENTLREGKFESESAVLKIDKKLMEIENQIRTLEEGKEIKTDFNNLERRKKNIEKELELLEEPIIVEHNVSTRETKGFELSGEKEILNMLKEGNVKVQGSTSMFELFKDIKNKLETRVFDKWHPVYKLVEQAKKKGFELPPYILDAYQQMRNTQGMVGRALHFINKGLGPLNFKTKDKIENAKSLLDLLEPIKTAKQYTEFNMYAIAKRTIEMIEQGKESGVSLKGAKEVAKKYEAKWGKTFKELNEYQNYLTKYLRDSGVISKEAYAIMVEMNKNYIPLHRVNDPANVSKTFSGQVGNPIKQQYGTEKARKRIEKMEQEKIELMEKLNTERQKGESANKEIIEKIGDQVKQKTLEIESSTKRLDILDPIETVYLNTLHFVQIAERNSALQSLVKMLKERPEAFPGITKEKAPLKTIDITKEVKKILGKEVSDKAAESFSIFRRDGQVRANGTQIEVFINGKKEVWNVGKEVAGAVKNMTSEQMSMFMSYASIPARTLRAGATLDPAFMLKNLNRDAITGAVISKYWTNIPYLTTLTGLFHMVNRTKMWERYTKSPAVQSTLVSMDRNYFRKGNVQAELLGRKVQNYVNPKNIVETLRVMADGIETSARLGDFIIGYRKMAKEKNLTEGQKLDYLGYDARNLTMDFARMGSKIQGINRISAFFAATIGGPYTMLSHLKQRPGQVITKASMYITLPSVLLWMDNHKSEVYKEVPQWQKDLFWIVIQNEGEDNQIVWRIPKPFDLGILFGTIPERILDYIYLNDKEAIENTLIEYGKTLLGSALPLPQAITPFFEDGMNRSFFYDRPIVPSKAEKLLSEYQYTPYTSETAKLIGSLIADVTEGEAGSPAKIDNYIRAWTGGLGQYAVSIMDHFFEKAGMVSPPPEPMSDNFIKNLADIPIVKAYVVRHPTASSASLEKFWKNYKKVFKRKETYDYIMRTFPSDRKKVKEAQKMFFDTDTNKSYAEKFSIIDGAKESITGMRHMIEFITLDKNMQPNEKRQLIDKFYKIMIEMAKNANQKMNEMNEEFDIY